MSCNEMPVNNRNVCTCLNSLKRWYLMSQYLKCQYLKFNVLYLISECLGDTVVRWLALSPHSKKVVGSYPGWPGLSVWSLHVLPVSVWVLSGYSGFLPPTKDMRARFIGVPKLSVGVHVWVSGCSSMCGPAMDWRPVQGVPRLSPDVCWDWLQPPHDPVRGISGWRWMDGWMDISFQFHISCFQIQNLFFLQRQIFFFGFKSFFRF